jgi:hypothetical protein
MRHVVINEDRRLLRDTAERFLRERYGFEQREAIRRSADGFDPAVWRTFAELGWLGLPFPTEFGGIGGTMLDVALLTELFGLALVAEPYMPAIAGGIAVMAGGSAAQREAILPALCEGRVRLALAFAERAGGYDFEAPTTAATLDGDRYRIGGAKVVVLGAPLADRLVVSAMVAGDAELSLFLVPADAAGVTMRAYATIDGQRGAEVAFADVAVTRDALIGEPGRGRAILRRAIDAGTVALLGEAAGIVQAAVEITGRHLNTREQFGRKLASFQALRHRIAHMFIGTQEVRALCRQAAAAYADDPDGAETREAIAAAKVHVGRVGRKICEEAIQLHGAIAISDEYVVGHYLKRMVAIDHMFGNANHHFDAYVAMARALAPVEA